VSRNSGTRRIREDTQGHEQGANQVQEDTEGPAGIPKDTSPRVRDREAPGSNPGPPTNFEFKNVNYCFTPSLPCHSRVTDFPAYGTMYGVKRTTIYLPEGLKSSLARAAHEAGRTEADLFREGVERLLQSRHTEPRLPLFTSGKPDLAENVDELLAGFGEE
jgi:hypothetical protein